MGVGREKKLKEWKKTKYHLSTSEIQFMSLTTHHVALTSNNTMINHKFSRHYRDYREYVIRFMSTNPKNHKINTHDKN